MNSIFSDMMDESLLVYLDNLLIFSSDIDSHYADVRKMLLQLCEHIFEAKSSKFIFSAMKLKYLGHIVINITIAMNPEKVRAVVSWPPPILVKSL